jgi:hypothetical protein
MEEGFILDYGHSQRYATSWVAGKPEPGFLGVKLWGKERHPIHSFCCQKCGYLEAYVLRQ